MKKFLLLSFLTIMALPAVSVDWQYVDTDIPNLNLFIDKDSIKELSPQETLFAIRYQTGAKPERAAYIKYNSADNKIGVIRAEDYDSENYHPNKVFCNTHAFMKPVEENSLLSYANEYVQYVFDSSDGIVPVAYKTNLQTYAASVAKNLEKNWIPAAHNTESIIILTLGRDGSLLNYKFAKPSGSNAVDRSIISAVEKTVPYKKLPSRLQSSDFQFVFSNGKFLKSVK